MERPFRIKGNRGEEMIFITETSVYELTKAGEYYRLQKLRLRDHRGYSDISQGWSLTAKSFWINENGGLETDTMHTSRVENLEEVRKFLGEVINGKS